MSEPGDEYAGFMLNASALYLTGAMALSQSTYLSWGRHTNEDTVVGITQNANGTLMFKDHSSGSWTEFGNSLDDTILGDASGDTITFNASTVAIPNNLNFDSNTLFLDASNNRVGIGTTSPGNPLDVQMNESGYLARFYALAGNQNAGILIRNGDRGYGFNVRHDLSETFVINEVIGETDIMAFTVAGNVGIGVTDPDELLEVAGDVKVSGANKLYFYDTGGEHISSDGTDLTIGSGNELNLTATNDVVIPVNVGLHFGDGNEKIESDNTNLTINSGVDINLTATNDINIPTDVGLTFGDDGEKIEGDGTNLAIASSAELDLTAGTTVDINATTTVTVDGTGISIDGTDDSNLTVTASGKDLDIAVDGGSTQELRLTSAGTGASAIHLNASAGGINIDAADMIDIDAADEITIDTTSADGHIAITSAHTAGQAILISANAADDSILDIDAGELDIDVQDEITIDTTSADGHIAITSAHTTGQSILISANAHAGAILDIDAGELDADIQGNTTLDVGGTLSIDVTGGASNITSTTDAGAEDFTIEVAGATDSSLILKSSGTGADALQIVTTAGGIDITNAGASGGEDIDISSTNASVSLVAGEAARDAIVLESDASGGGIHIEVANADGIILMGNAAGDTYVTVEAHDTAGSELIKIVNADGTTDGTNDAGAIELSAAAGGIGLAWGAAKDLWAQGGKFIVTAEEDDAGCIKLHADAGTAQTILIQNDAGTAAGAINIAADAGGITLDAGDDIIFDADNGEVVLKDGGVAFLAFNTGGTAGLCNIENGAGDAVVLIDDGDRNLYFWDKGGEYIKGDGTDLTLTSGGDIILTPGGGDVLPDGDNTRNLGSASKRWANIYTGDLHLKNDRGDWTVVEEEDYICVVNNKTNKKYKMMLEEVKE